MIVCRHHALQEHSTMQLNSSHTARQTDGAGDRTGSETRRLLLHPGDYKLGKGVLVSYL